MWLLGNPCGVREGGPGARVLAMKDEPSWTDALSFLLRREGFEMQSPYTAAVGQNRCHVGRAAQQDIRQSPCYQPRPFRVCH